MNKQQLAAKIWESANRMRSTIAASDYKDYILGFMFYKFLSEKELKYLKNDGWEDEDIVNNLNETDSDRVTYLKENIGYFIAYENLFSTWIHKGSDLGVDVVRDALNAFNRLTKRKDIFGGVFDTLQTGLSKLGTDSGSQSKAIRELIELIDRIPMDDRQGYDILGFIYEYLLEKFAANAGKKAGEFYTPHEVSVLISEIVSNHLRDRDTIKIFDPTSGSGSLLINIGKSAAKYIAGKNKIKYYAQELKENTYNLTRMNLVMRGISADNIVVRNADTLQNDWPYFNEDDPVRTYDPLYVDAVVSNPPYSQRWDSKEGEGDPRYTEYGIAPKGKADYAFLLHDLYHIKPDGIVNIVLPHGVLFRGNEEREIRKNLVENTKIDTIIGLPPNLFYGTSIPTIIMILKQKRDNTDVLIVDASKGFIKDGKNNRLRASDIKKIVDVVVQRKNVKNFSRIVTRDEIRNNDYNLNIPRYVDSMEAPESWDIYASMFGGIPVSEANALNEYWKIFPTLKDTLLMKVSSEYCALATSNIKEAIENNVDVKAFKMKYQEIFKHFEEELEEILFLKMEDLDLSKMEDCIADHIFKKLSTIPLIDKYEAYQVLDDEWTDISIDLEMIQTEGFATTKKVDPRMKIKNEKGKEREVQVGWQGHILPFKTVQKYFLSHKLHDLSISEKRMEEINSEYEQLIDELEIEARQRLLNDDDTAFVRSEIKKAYEEILDDISTPEIELLQNYLSLSKKIEKLQFIKECKEIKWAEMAPNKDETYGKKAVNKYIDKVKSTQCYGKGTYEDIVIKAKVLLDEESSLKKDIEKNAKALEEETKALIEGLSDAEVFVILKDKWIVPLFSNIMILPDKILSEIVVKVENLSKKYETNLVDVEEQIVKTEKELSSMLGELEGNEFDILGLNEFKRLLEDG